MTDLTDSNLKEIAAFVASFCAKGARIEVSPELILRLIVEVQAWRQVEAVTDIPDAVMDTFREQVDAADKALSAWGNGDWLAFNLQQKSRQDTPDTNHA